MNNDWKPEPQTPEQVEQGLKDAMKQAKEDGVFDWYETKFPELQINNPKLSNWTCYLFGGSLGDGIVWTPQEGKVPNAWVRFWMKVFFDCKWVKYKDD